VTGLLNIGPVSLEDMGFMAYMTDSKRVFVTEQNNPYGIKIIGLQWFMPSNCDSKA
jgi:hypothetical protein